MDRTYVASRVKKALAFDYKLQPYERYWTEELARSDVHMYIQVSLPRFTSGPCGMSTRASRYHGAINNIIGFGFCFCRDQIIPLKI